MKLLLTLVLLLSFETSYAAKDDFAGYIKSASNVNLGMNQRWKALMSAAESINLKEVKQLEQIRKFSKNSAWFMRNASLIALKKINSNEAMQTAKKLLSDKALVVRSAAVEVISGDLTEENKKILMDELNQNYNFHKNSSLWIRKQILSNLMPVADLADREFFAKNLFDKDQNIADMCAQALGKITGDNLSGKDRIDRWKKIVKQNDWL